MVAFAPFVVVADHPSAITAIKQAVLETMRPFGVALGQSPDTHFKDGYVWIDGPIFEQQRRFLFHMA